MFNGDLLCQLPGDIRVRYLSWDLVELFWQNVWECSQSHCRVCRITNLSQTCQVLGMLYIRLCFVHHNCVFPSFFYISFLITSIFVFNHLLWKITQGLWRMHPLHFMPAFRPREKPMPRNSMRGRFVGMKQWDLHFAPYIYIDSLRWFIR